MSVFKQETVVPLGRSMEQSVRVRADPVPQIRNAGSAILGIRERENADFCVRQDVHLPPDAPSTPEHLKKYRKSHVNEPGKIQKHWGFADDKARFPPTYSYGKTTYQSEGVGIVIKAQNLNGLADAFNEIKEDKYASHQREPLGTGYSRQYQWPDKVQMGQTSFGLPTQGLESAKEIVFPKDGASINKDAEIQALYRKTHGNYDPGEQKKREYEWNFDPTQHRFGYGDKKVLNGAALAVHNERLEEQFPKTVIVKKTVEDHKAVSSDQLGQSRNLGQGQVNRGPDFVHGVKNVQGSDPWNAARCIHGEPSEREVKPDNDLGKSVRQNCRNVVHTEEDRNRSFGLPTIRKDIPYKDFKSVADYQNYGDEPEAVDLLFPSNYQEKGVSEHDFKSLRSRDEIKSLFEKIGFSYKQGKFNAMYNRAKELSGDFDDKISVRAFQMAISEMHNIE